MRSVRTSQVALPCRVSPAVMEPRTSSLVNRTSYLRTDGSQPTQMHVDNKGAMETSRPCCPGPSGGTGPPSTYFFARSSTSWFRMSTTFSAISLLNRTLLFRHMLTDTPPFETTAMCGAREKT